jgi:hypothetical protein
MYFLDLDFLYARTCTYYSDRTVEFLLTYVSIVNCDWGDKSLAVHILFVLTPIVSTICTYDCDSNTLLCLC